MRNKLILSFFVILLLLFSAPACSFGADQVGEGGGQNQDEPLKLVSSSILNNQQNVSVKPVIQLEFSKNVVNMTVAENNKKAFLLTDKKGETVPIQIQMGDDQVDPTIKRLIQIVPEKELNQGETYTLTIQQTLTAKSGAALPEAVRITFETDGGGIKAGNDNSEDSAAGNVENSEQPEFSDQTLIKDETENATQPDVSDNQNLPASNEKTNRWIYFSAACFAGAVLLFGVYFYRRRK